jgi:isopropylmalate/homocitrate/citramalate synthase
VLSDIDAAVDAGVESVSVILGGSDSHLRDKLHLTEGQAIDVLQRAVRHTTERGALCGFALEDFSRTPLPRLLRLCQAAADAGAYMFFLPDTIGVLTPVATYRLVRMMKAVFPGVPIAMHCHNDLGLALANTLAGLEAGASQAQATVNGVGERCGNTCLVELAVVLRVKYGLDVGLKLDRLAELSRLVHRLTGTEPPPHKPVTGRFSFSHESGIHVAGLLANREAYQPYPPELVGRRHEIVFGKHSGREGVQRLARQGGVSLSEPAAREVLARIKDEAERRRTSVPDETVLAWIRAEAATG